MARRPPEDPRVTDLRRYKKAREAQVSCAQKPVRRNEAFLGSRPRAGVILVLVILGFLALTVLPGLL